MDHDELLAWIRGGDPAALEFFFREFHGRIYGWCLTALRHPQDAEEATSQVLVAVTRTRLAGAEALTPYVRRMALNACASLLRARGRSITDAPGDDEFGDPAAASVDLLADAGRDELRALVWRAMSGLSPRDRFLFEAEWRDGLDNRQLAELVGTSQPYVVLNRMRRQVAAALGAAVVAWYGRRDCQELDRLVTLTAIETENDLSPLLRKRVNRHVNGTPRVEGCPTCRACRDRWPLPVFGAALPVLAVPELLGARLTGDVQATLASGGGTHMAQAGGAGSGNADAMTGGPDAFGGNAQISDGGVARHSMSGEKGVAGQQKQDASPGDGGNAGQAHGDGWFDRANVDGGPKGRAEAAKEHTDVVKEADVVKQPDGAQSGTSDLGTADVQPPDASGGTDFSAGMDQVAVPQPPAPAPAPAPSPSPSPSPEPQPHDPQGADNSGTDPSGASCDPSMDPTTQVPSDLPCDLPTQVPSDLPCDLPTQVPSDLPCDLPTQIPDLPIDPVLDVPVFDPPVLDPDVLDPDATIIAPRVTHQPRLPHRHGRLIRRVPGKFAAAGAAAGMGLAVVLVATLPSGSPATSTDVTLSVGSSPDDPAKVVRDGKAGSPVAGSSPTPFAPNGEPSMAATGDPAATGAAGPAGAVQSGEPARGEVASMPASTAAGPASEGGTTDPTPPVGTPTTPPVPSPTGTPTTAPKPSDPPRPTPTTPTTPTTPADPPRTTTAPAPTDPPRTTEPPQADPSAPSAPKPPRPPVIGPVAPTSPPPVIN